jgi:hypothetical protein
LEKILWHYVSTYLLEARHEAGAHTLEIKQMKIKEKQNSTATPKKISLE